MRMQAAEGPHELDLLGLYMREIDQYTLLTAEEEQELARAISRGREAAHRLAQGEQEPSLPRQIEAGQRARQRLIQCNSFLVVSLARRYRSPDFTLSDLIQEGNVGLLRAADKFDYRRGTRFSTYATYWIRQMISRYIGTQRYAVRLPSHQAEALAHYRRVHARLIQEDAELPSLEHVAHTMGMSLSNLAHLLCVIQPSLSLEDKPEGDERPLAETLHGAQAEVEQQVSEHLLRQSVRKLLSTLTARESRVLELRFGLRGGKTHTLEGIAQRFGLTKERIRRPLPPRSAGMRVGVTGDRARGHK
jgi:RNA polymerase primary sigma factor